MSPGTAPRARHEGQTQEAFPVGARGIYAELRFGAAWIQDDPKRLVPTPPTPNFWRASFGRTRHLFSGMSDRPASWRMPTPKQMAAKPGLARMPDLPPEYWQALLDDPCADTRPVPSGAALRLSQISQHVLRVNCRRCARIVEIRRPMQCAATDWRLCGRTSDSACWTPRARSAPGGNEEDGCWPSFDMP